MSAPARRLRAADRVLELGGRPWLMGVVSAAPHRGASGARDATLQAQLDAARELLGAGADILEVDACPERAGVPAIDVQEQVAQLVAQIVAELRAVVSVRACEPLLARAAIAAGASIVDEPRAPYGRAVAELCAQTGAALVLAPDRIDAALGAGMEREQLIVNAALDLAATRAQAIGPLVDVVRLHELGAPLLLDLSRGLIGALLGSSARGLPAGTLAALAHGVDTGVHILRVDDVSAARDFLTVRTALSGEIEPSRDLALAEELRHEPSVLAGR
ncbi:MAG: dihydropteroate synthase [Solirubrobacteraceae bacterium]